MLQFHHDQPPEFAVVEQEVDVKVVAVELDALLPGDEGKARAQLQQEGFQLPEDGVFQVTLQKAVGKPQKIQNIT